MFRSSSAYFWVCFAMCVGVMGTALASPLYPLYQEAWGLLPSHITIVFVAYMIGTLASLLGLARLSDRFGFLAMLRAGLILMTAGILICAIAWGMISFTLGRIVIGLASGIITSSASMGLTRLIASQGGSLHRASAMTSLTLAAGFGLGPIVGGLVAQWAPWPLRTSYVPSLVLGVLSIYALGRIRLPAGSVPAPAPGAVSLAQLLQDMKPQLTFPAAAGLRYFWISGMCAFSAFGVFSMFASLAPSFMAQMLPWHGPAASGLSIGVILLGSAAAQFVSRPLPTRLTTIAGLLALGLGNLLMLANTLWNSSFVFVLCVICAAAGHGWCNLAGMSTVQKIANDDNRAGLLATYLVIGYIGCTVPILGLGWLSDHLGLLQGVALFSGAFAVLTLAVAALTVRTPRLGG